MRSAEKLAQFLDKSHSCYHAVEEIRNQLAAEGFIELIESEGWMLESGKNYYVVRNGSSIIGFKIPDICEVNSINMVCSHTDSPAFKLKQNCEVSVNNYQKFNVEKYGGGIYSTWLDRPLSVAGRVVTRENGKLVSRLFDIDEDYCLIPNVAIHQNRAINKGYEYNVQTDLCPLVGQGEDKEYLMNRISSILNVDKMDVLGHDLYLYNRQKATIWGNEKQFISGQRLDDLECVYASLEAFKEGSSANSISMYCAFNNEEVGSQSVQGMASTFMIDVIERIFDNFSFTASHIKAVLANSFMVSLDNAHGIHPNHPELYDKDNNVRLNGGVVIKTQAELSYVTDGLSQAIISELCQNNNIPYQFFANRSDMASGGTQAKAAIYNVSVLSCDLGLAQLAMHSTYETAGSEDVDHMINLIRAVYNSTIINKKGTVEIY